MNGRDDGDDDEKQPEQDVAPPAHSGTAMSAPSHPDADDGNKIKAPAEPQKTESPESVAAETLQRVRVTEIAMVILTAVIALSGILTVWVYWHQLDVMQDTLNEIKTGGEDTHVLMHEASRQANFTKTLADQTTSQAAQAKSLAEQTTSLAEQTTKLAEQTTSLVKYAGKSATAAEKSQAATEKLAGSTSEAAAASQKLAAAANDANAVSRELVKTTQQVGEINTNAQRAFVFVSGVSLRKVSYAEWYRALVESNGLTVAIMPVPTNLPAQQTIGWQANITWENSGNTPTKNLTISGNLWTELNGKPNHPIDVAAIPLDDKFLVKFPDQKIFIGPKQSAPIPVAFFEPMQLLLGALFRPQYYVFGTATYQDILNPSLTHRIDYCFWIHLTGDFRSGLSGDGKGLEPFGADLIPCAKHNCMDEECDQKPSQPPPQPTPPPAPVKPPG
jgi:hypothetical protein